MKYHHWLLVAALTASLSACSSNKPVRNTVYQGDFIAYQCSSGGAFQLALMPNEDKALLRLPEGDYRMVRVPSGSGTKYILDDGTAKVQNPVTLYTKGNEARLEVGITIYKDCIGQ